MIMRYVSTIIFLFIVLIQLNFLSAATISKKILQKYTEEDSVLVLKDNNFNDSLIDFPHIIVQLYAYWSKDAQNFASDLSKAAQALRHNDPPIVIGKIDGASNGIPLTRFKMNKVPTLKLFMHNQTNEIDYKGPLNSGALIKWAQKLCGPLLTEIIDIQQFENMKQKHDILLVYFGDENRDQELKVLKQLAQKYPDIEFAYSISQSHINELKVKPNSVGLYKQFDDRYNVYNKSIDVNQLTLFIESNSYPNLMMYNYRAYEKIFSQQNSALFLLVDDSEKSKAAEDIIKELSKSLKGRIQFTMSKLNGEFADLNKQIMEYFAVLPEQLPAIRIVGFQGKESKYKYEEKEIQKKKIEQLISKFRIRKLLPYLKSQPIPIDNSKNIVKIAVSDNFEQLVIESNEDVLVEFYADDCTECTEVTKKMDKMGKVLLQNKNIILARINLSKNELDFIDKKDAPKLKFYKSGQKNQKSLDVSHTQSTKEIINWIKDNHSFTWIMEGKIDL